MAETPMSQWLHIDWVPEKWKGSKLSWTMTEKESNDMPPTLSMMLRDTPRTYPLQWNNKPTPTLLSPLDSLIALYILPRHDDNIDNNNKALTVLKLQNLGQPKTNCTASNKLLFPLPLRPTTQFISGEKGWISGCCLNDRKLERVTDLMCIFLFMDVVCCC